MRVGMGCVKMDILHLLDNKTMKPVEKRNEIEKAIRAGTFTIQDIESLAREADAKEIVLVFEAMEAITTKNPEIATIHWLICTQEFISSEANALKREASRIVGNIASLFPNDLKTAIQKLLANTKVDSTVLRWSSAYALGRIICIPQHAQSELFAVVTKLSEQEKENGVRNQYLHGLKKAKM